MESHRQRYFPFPHLLNLIKKLAKVCRRCKRKVSKTSDREVNEVSDKIASLSELIVKVLVGRPTFSE